MNQSQRARGFIQMKKAISILLSIVMLLSFVACGAGEKPTEKPKASSTDIIIKDIGISMEVYKYCYISTWLNFYEASYIYDTYYGEGSGLQETGFDRTKAPTEQAYKDDYSEAAGVTIAEIQRLGVDNPTWADVLCYKALVGLIEIKYFANKAKAEGLAITEENQTEIQKNIDNSSKIAAKVDCSLEEFFGTGITEKTIREYFEDYYLAMAYSEKLNADIKNSITEDEINAEYQKNKAAYDSAGDTNVVDVRHILIAFSSENPSTEEKAKSYQTAQDILKEYSRKPTEENFVNLAKTKSQDPGSAEAGGLYTEVSAETSFVEPFLNWSIDSARQVGDVDIVETDYGYHIMYLSKIHGKTGYFKARDAIFAEKYSENVDDVLETYLENVNLKSTKIASATEKQNKIIETRINE